MPKIEKTCLHCGKTLQLWSSKSSQKYCSLACYHEHAHSIGLKNTLAGRTFGVSTPTAYWWAKQGRLSILDGEIEAVGRPKNSRKILVINGVEKSYSDWAKSIGISTQAFGNRVNNGTYGGALLRPKWSHCKKLA